MGGVQGHRAGHGPPVESNEAGRVHRRTLIDEHVRCAVDRGIPTAAKGLRFGSNAPDFTQVLVQAVFTVVALGGVAPQVTVVRIRAAVLAVFVAHVDHGCARDGQQPRMGLQGGRIGRIGPGLARKALLGPLVPFVRGTGVGPRSKARNVVAANKGHHDRPVDVLVLAARRPVIEVHVVLFANGEHAV